MKLSLAAIAAVSLCCASAAADTTPDSHAPIGVMGDHMHKKGELMFSYRFMHMAMQGNRVGTSGISAQEIATTIPNRFANPPMMPPTLRVVPTEMSMQMHMFGAMYAPSDRVTLMGMVNYVDTEMVHTTFMGASGDIPLGNFTTQSSGIGDTTVAALIRLTEGAHSGWHATLGLSLPTGDIDETASVLTPMNTRPVLRMPYPMQLGSGTYDLIGGATYTANRNRLGFGGQWRSVMRLDKNDEGYALGDEHQLSAWLSYRVKPSTSVSARLGLRNRGNISGIDPQIMAPVQTADPDRQGGGRLDAGLGINHVLPGDRHRLAVELLAPVWQDLDGPQMETDWQIVVGWQFTP